MGADQQPAPAHLQLILYAEIISLDRDPARDRHGVPGRSLFDKASGTISFGLLSVPNFILAVLLVFLFALKLGWLPATGYTPFRESQ